MRDRALRGVNLGGWLVLERWMTPSVFVGTEAQDEYTFMQTPGAQDKIDTHRREFITEADFQWLHKAGVEAVRIPVGYWVLASNGPYVEASTYLDWAFQMAETYQLRVLLDLHGAPGSQNGHDHSGRIGYPAWFDKEIYRTETLSILKALHQRYHASPAYWGLEFLNEPKGSNMGMLRQFYREVSQATDGDQYMVFSDAFRPLSMNGALPGEPRAVMDVHIYHMASKLRHVLPVSSFVQVSNWWYTRLLRHLSKHQPVIVGEWSMVLRGESLRRFSDGWADELMHNFGHQQIEAYDRASLAWFYWSYKTESPNKWNFRYLVDEGLLVLP